jgi:hypothetical protein
MLASRLITVWISLILVGMGILLPMQPTTDTTFYRFGPHSDLIVLGFVIDNYTKYLLIILYCMCNTLIRAINHSVIIPWITLTIQDTSPEAEAKKAIMNQKMAYEISIISTIYAWFDWFIYINLLLAQVDMVLAEVGMDIIATAIITYLYMNPAP